MKSFVGFITEAKKPKAAPSACQSIPKTEGHKYQESLAVALEVVVANKNNGCQGDKPGKYKCYSVTSTGAGSGTGDVTLSGPKGDLKIECKKGYAQGGDMTFTWNGGAVNDPNSWKFKGVAGKMCPTNKEKTPLKAALCTSITKMLTGPLGAALANRAKLIHAWQLENYGPSAVGKLEYPLVTLKEGWLVASDKFPMKGAGAGADGESASYYNTLGKEEYWGSLTDILVQKGDQFVQFMGHGLFRVADDPYGIGKALGVPTLTESFQKATEGGRVEVRVRPSGFSKTGGRLVKKPSGMMPEAPLRKTLIEKDRGIIVNCTDEPKSGMHIHVPELGKKVPGIDLYEYSVPGHPDLKAKMAGSSSSKHYTYEASTEAREGEYIGTIEFTMKPIKLPNNEWYVKGNFKHRTAKVALSAILRIDDKVTATLKPSTVTLDNPAHMQKMVDSLPPCK